MENKMTIGIPPLFRPEDMEEETFSYMDRAATKIGRKNLHLPRVVDVLRDLRFEFSYTERSISFCGRAQTLEMTVPTLSCSYRDQVEGPSKHWKKSADKEEWAEILETKEGIHDAILKGGYKAQDSDLIPHFVDCLESIESKLVSIASERDDDFFTRLVNVAIVPGKMPLRDFGPYSLRIRRKY